MCMQISVSPSAPNWRRYKQSVINEPSGELRKVAGNQLHVCIVSRDKFKQDSVELSAQVSTS